MNNTIIINKKNTKLIAHRGLSGIEKENTCASFVLAGNHTYYGIETDVHVSNDGKYIICHDDDLKRVSNEKYIIEKTDYNILKQVVLFDTDNKTKRNDLFLPLLEDYIKICKKYNKQAILELKNDMEEKHIMNIVNIIDSFSYLNKTTFISFSRNNLIILRSHNRDISIQYLTADADDNTLEFIKEYHLDLDIYYKSLNKDYVDKMHNNNILVNCWTVDTKSEAESLVEMGVDFITTNILE